MNIEYLYSRLSIAKAEMDFSKLKEEDSKLSLILEKLSKSLELLDNIKYLLQEARKLMREIYRIDPRAEEEYTVLFSELKNILNFNDPEIIYLKLEEIHNKSVKYLKDVKALRSKYLEELKSQLASINQRLIIYQKIYMKILNKDIDIKIFETKYDNIEELYRAKEEATNKLKELHDMTIQDLKSISNMSEAELELLIELLDKGEIKVNKKNLNSILKITKTLVEKGLNVQVRI